MENGKLRKLLLLILSCYLSVAHPAQNEASAFAGQTSPQATNQDAPDRKSADHGRIDRRGKARHGKASYYGPKFYSRKMADSTPMDPQSNAAASKTLPLGTKARVTNLKNGKSEVVEIRDRGPYVKNRIVDVSPKTADELGLKKDGIAPVEVKTLEVKPGASGVQ
ncbi:septal ring lytic transglycosylase RlpA family protein [Paraburkholderia terrae]